MKFSWKQIKKHFWGFIKESSMTGSVALLIWIYLTLLGLTEYKITLGKAFIFFLIAFVLYIAGKEKGG